MSTSARYFTIVLLSALALPWLAEAQTASPEEPAESPTIDAEQDAEQEAPVILSTRVQAVEYFVSEDGVIEERTTDAERVFPETVLLYTITLQNQSNASLPAGSVAVSTPVPAFTTYQPNSAGGAETEILFSLDSGESWTFEDPEHPVAYSQIRWLLQRDLEPGAETEVFFRLQMDRPF